jgi:hypothetical protein
MDKGTSESSLLGAGSPLPSIPLHSIISYLLYRIRPDTSIECEKGRKLSLYILHFSIDRDPHPVTTD